MIFNTPWPMLGCLLVALAFSTFAIFGKDHE